MNKPITVAMAKLQITALLEELHGQGICIRAMQICWSTEVRLEDQPKLESKTKCSLKFEADL